MNDCRIPPELVDLALDRVIEHQRRVIELNCEMLRLLEIQQRMEKLLLSASAEDRRDVQGGLERPQDEPHKLDEAGSTPAPATLCKSGQFLETGSRESGSAPYSRSSLVSSLAPVLPAAVATAAVSNPPAPSLSLFFEPQVGCSPHLTAGEHNKFPKGRWC